MGQLSLSFHTYKVLAACTSEVLTDRESACLGMVSERHKNQKCDAPETKYILDLEDST